MYTEQWQDGLTAVHNSHYELVTDIEDSMVSQWFTVPVAVVNRCELSRQTCRYIYLHAPPLSQHDGTDRDWIAAFPLELTTKTNGK